MSLVLVATTARAEGLWEVRLRELPAGTSAAMASPDHYADAVEKLIRRFEAQVGRELTPGDKGRVGLKLYAESGPGLATPQPLVRAVIEALMRRGYARENIFLVGLNQLRLRLTGYLPTDPRLAPPFAGHPFYVLESGRYYDPVWFYDSPLPSRFDPILSGRQDRAPDFDLDRLAPADPDAKLDLDADRKSFLATPLFLDADFWINLPVYTDHEALGVNGALVNATLWNASNTSRFFRSTRSAPAAVAEMAAVPELRQTWAFTLASLEQWQFVGGPSYNALYTRGEPRLWLGMDPVRMDALMLERINRARREAGFQPVADEIRTLEFAETLGVGKRRGAEPMVVE
ncbi:MAG: DUF362 domain-containing protein [Opitutaceae bacterium]|nr:DUF362 domain-containing protein [Opitutaceae bacterium]